MQINQCIYVIAHSIHVARLCLRGNRNDLITHGLSNLLVVEPATALQVSHRGHKPKINPAQGIVNLYNPCYVWGRTQFPRLWHRCATPAMGRLVPKMSVCKCLTRTCFQILFKFRSDMATGKRKIIDQLPWYIL